MNRHRIVVALPGDFALFEAAIALEIFARPHRGIDRAWYDVQIVTYNPGPTRVAGGLFQVTAARGIDALDEAETVILPPALSLDRPVPPELIAALRRANERGARLISFCTGAFVLAAAGILDGREATTHWAYAQRLAREFPQVRVTPQALYVGDGRVLTAAGTAASLDLSLHVVRTDHGAEVARQISRALVLAPHREGAQIQQIASTTPDRTELDLIARAMDYAGTHLDEDLSIQALAAVAFMSTRNLSRRFRQQTGTTPARWVLQQRLLRVRTLLEETDLSIEKIASVTGFGRAATLRQRFTEALHVSPTGYRRAVRAGRGSVAS